MLNTNMDPFPDNAISNLDSVDISLTVYTLVPELDSISNGSTKNEMQSFVLHNWDNLNNKKCLHLYSINAF